MTLRQCSSFHQVERQLYADLGNVHVPRGSPPFLERISEICCRSRSTIDLAFAERSYFAKVIGWVIDTVSS